MRHFHRLSPRPDLAHRPSNQTLAISTPRVQLGAPVDPVVIQIHEYEPTLFKFHDFHDPSFNPTRMNTFYTNAIRALRDAQGTLQPFDFIPGNSYTYADHRGTPTLRIALRGAPAPNILWKLCYEDVEEVLNALIVYVRLWAQSGEKAKAAHIQVFRDGRKLSIYGVFDVGLVMSL